MVESKHILFISYDGMSDPLGQSQVIPYLAGLSKFGYHFTILSCEKKDKYKKDRDIVNSLLKPYDIKWVPIQYHKTPPILSSLFDYFLLKRQARLLHLSHKVDMVHTRPGVPTLVALWLKRKYGIKFLNDIRGFWADERVDGGMWNLQNPIFRFVHSFFKRHELQCIQLSDYNTCLTNKAKEEIIGWKTTADPAKIEVIPCSVDLHLFDPENVNPVLKKQFKDELGIQNEDLIITYLGSIGGWYLVDEMMAFFKSMEMLIPNAKFLFISPHRHEYIIAAASRSGIPPQKIISRETKRNEVPILLSFSTYSIFFIKKCYSKISSSPTKHGEIMAMGIPVITNEGIGDVSEIVNHYNSGIVLKNIDDRFNVEMNQVLSGVRYDQKRIRDGAKEYYSLENALDKYRKVYSAILG